MQYFEILFTEQEEGIYIDGIMPSLHIYKTNSVELSIRKTLSQLLEELPQSMHPRALRYRREADAYNFIAGRLLLQRGLEDLGIDDRIDHIQLGESGKPFLRSVSFNISHTDDWVVCALSENGHIGIDIEKEKKVDLDNFRSWFTPTEWSTIHESVVPIHQFYRYWTRKESIIKALGLKLSNLNQMDLDIRKGMFDAVGKRWYVGELAWEAGYFGAICSEVKLDTAIRMRYIDL